MSATVKWYRYTGAGPSTTDITGTTTRVSLSDSASPGSANPVVIPASGSGSTNYAWWAVTALYATVTPVGTVDTIKVYTDGSNSFGSGSGMKFATSSTYVQATSASSTSGTQMSSGVITGLSTPTDAFTYTSSAPLSVSGSISNPSTGKISDYVYQQVSLTETFTPGPSAAAETITGKYNET